MSNQKKLPLTLQNLPMPFEAHVYPSPEGGRGVIVKGQGHITLTFEETKDPKIAQVRIKDIEAKLAPNRIIFDLDRDGKLEHIDLEGLELDVRAFDLERSGGDYNLKNGHIRLNFIFSISPVAFLHLGEQLDSKDISPIHFEIAEQGWLDLETGHFLTHSAPFTVREGAFSGLTIMGTQRDEDVAVEQILWIDLRVVIQTGVQRIPSSFLKLPKEVWICPLTPVKLCWESADRGVKISPPLRPEYNPTPQHFPEPPSGSSTVSNITDDKVYTAKTLPLSANSGHDEVLINVANGRHWTKTLEAKFDDVFGCWVALLGDYEYDQNVKVARIWIRTQDYETMEHLPDSISHDNWRLEHLYSDDVVFTSISVDEDISIEDGFAMPGEYRFRPVLKSGEELPPKEMLYFHLWGYCGK